MTAVDWEAARELRQRLAQRVKIEDFRVFGSRVRGEATLDSDRPPRPSVKPACFRLLASEVPGTYLGRPYPKTARGPSAHHVGRKPRQAVPVRGAAVAIGSHRYPVVR